MKHSDKLQCTVCIIVNLCPHARLVFIFPAFVTIFSNFTNRNQNAEKQCLIQYRDCKLWSGSKVFVSNHSLTEQKRAGAASLRQSRITPPPTPPPPPPAKQTIQSFLKLQKSTQSHKNDEWYPWQLIISIIRWVPVGVIFPLSLHIRLRKPLNTLSRLVWSNFSVRLEESGPRHRLGTAGRSWGICCSAFFVRKANQIQSMPNTPAMKRACIHWHTRVNSHEQTRRRQAKIRIIIVSWSWI